MTDPSVVVVSGVGEAEAGNKHDAREANGGQEVNRSAEVGGSVVDDNKTSNNVCSGDKQPSKGKGLSVAFPDDSLVLGYMEPPNPWKDGKDLNGRRCTVASFHHSGASRLSSTNFISLSCDFFFTNFSFVSFWWATVNIFEAPRLLNALCVCMSCNDALKFYSLSQHIIFFRICYYFVSFFACF